MDRSTTPAPAPLVFAGTGTDTRFPFPRLVDWTVAWAAAQPAGTVDLLVQRGVTPCPPEVASVQLYTGAEIDGLMERAAAAVLQGGPGGIMRARQAGLKPIVVPRLGSLDEAVDDHQVEFTEWAAGRDWVVDCRTAEQLAEALDRVVADPRAYRFTPEPSATAEVVERFGRRIDQLLAT